MTRFSFIPVILLLLTFISCERRQKILSEGDFVGTDSSLLHWKEYIIRDSFFREISSQGRIVTLSKCASQKDFIDSTFSETDYYTGGQPKASRNFVLGTQQGVWKTWYENGTAKSASVVDAGVLRDYASYYDDGAVAVTASRADDGTMSRTDRWRNGNLKEEFITDSLGNGKCTNYYLNGRKEQEGMLFRFTPSGDWQRWDSLGIPLSDTTYGKPVMY